MQEYIIELGLVKISEHLMDFEHSFGRFIKMCKKGGIFFPNLCYNEYIFFFFHFHSNKI